MSDQDTAREHLDEVLRQFDVAMLVTRTPEGTHTRPMAIAEIDSGGDLWFVTDRGSDKVGEITRDGEVNVSVQGDRVYACVAGLAEPVEDRARVRKLWNESWRVWYPNGPDDASLMLLHVVPIRGEYWDNRGERGLRFLWKAAKSYVRREKLEDGELPPEQHGLADFAEPNAKKKTRAA